MDLNAFFVETCQDLRARVTPPLPEWPSNTTIYRLLRSAALLRQLLFDTGEPLVEAVNRAYHLQLSFEIHDHETGSARVGMQTRYHMMAGNPHHWPARLVSKKQLLATLVLQRPMPDGNLERITVKDLLDHAAYVRGGVHRGVADSRSLEAVTDAQQNMVVGEYDLPLRMVHELGRIVIAGLGPLVERASAERTVIDRFHVRERGARFADFDTLDEARRIGRMLAGQSEELEIIETATGVVVERLDLERAREREADDRDLVAEALVEMRSKARG